MVGGEGWGLLSGPHMFAHVRSGQTRWEYHFLVGVNELIWGPEVLTESPKGENAALRGLSDPSEVHV